MTMFLSFFILKEGAKKEFNSIHSKEKSLQERCALPKKMSLVGNNISGEKTKKKPFCRFYKNILMATSLEQDKIA
jgi:hypothetical protein